jgi:4-hydroxy-4-methyl-2-oxoglutarate aldolase
MSRNFKDDKDLFDFIEQNLYTAVISDVMDEHSITGFVMSEKLRPLTDDFIVAGRARTILWVDIFEEKENPYEKEIEVVDSLKPGDISVHCTSYSTRNAPWGELMTTASIVRGAKAAIVEGFIRDTTRIKEMKFPVFCTGIKPLDSKGRGMVVEYDVPVECGGVLVKNKDLIVADFDGIVVVPAEYENMIIAEALDKVSKENLTRKELLEGVLLKDVYAKYGVL